MSTTRLLLVAVVVSSLAAAQRAPAADPRVDAVFSRFDVADSPGCAVAVAQNGTIAYARG